MRACFVACDRDGTGTAQCDERIGNVAESYNTCFQLAARRNKNNGLGRWQVLCVGAILERQPRTVAMKQQHETIIANWRSRTRARLARDTDFYEAVLSFYEEVGQAVAAAQPAESPAPIEQHSSPAGQRTR